MLLIKQSKKKNSEKKLESTSFKELSKADENLKVVLLGRPYTVLSQTMNSNIPEIFAQKGVKTFFQDMLDVNENEIDSLQEILSDTKWKFAATILSVPPITLRAPRICILFLSLPLNVHPILLSLNILSKFSIFMINHI